MTAHNGNPADSPKPGQCGVEGCYVWTQHDHYGPNVTLSQPAAQTPPTCTPVLAAGVAAVERVRAARLRGHQLNLGGTTDCPAQRVRAHVDGMTCSACGAEVSS